MVIPAPDPIVAVGVIVVIMVAASMLDMALVGAGVEELDPAAATAAQILVEMSVTAGDMSADDASQTCGET